jgi:hypothetical protein
VVRATTLFVFASHRVYFNSLVFVDSLVFIQKCPTGTSCTPDLVVSMRLHQSFVMLLIDCVQESCFS